MIVVFAASHFERHTQDWWVHHREEYWSNDGEDDEPAQYHYSSWSRFVNLINKQFQDQAVEEVHKKQMNKLCMGNRPATVYFQELEKEAKLAGRRGDKSEQ